MMGYVYGLLRGLEYHMNVYIVCHSVTGMRRRVGVGDTGDGVIVLGVRGYF